jgi:hypothetical protein
LCVTSLLEDYVHLHWFHLLLSCNLITSFCHVVENFL